MIDYLQLVKTLQGDRDVGSTATVLKQTKQLHQVASRGEMQSTPKQLQGLF